MENYGQNKKNRKKKSTSKVAFGSIALVFVAVLSFIAISFGRSYAVDAVVNRLPDTFETADPRNQIVSDSGFTTFSYFTTGGIQVFCLEHKVDFVAGKTFNKGEAITDQGLLYLLANIYPNVKYDSFLDDSLRSWISQVAIWLYLYENEKQANGGTVSADSPNYMSAEEFDQIATARGVIVDDNSELLYYTGNSSTGGKSTGGTTASDPLLYDKYIKPLVNAALANREVRAPSLSINFGSDIAITQDNKYYQTSQVSVSGNPSENFNSYELKINSAPEGTLVVDADGNRIEDLTKLSVTDKFYFRIPVDKLTEDNKVVKFSINGSFRGYSGFYYTAENAQTITGVSTQDKVISDGAEIPINYTPEVPDTGMSTAQTVYFIGLIILLSGVGIIYANVKPKESK